VNRVLDDTAFGGLTLLSTHLSHGVSPADRLAQVEAINQWLRGQDENGLMILTGDLNATPETQEMRNLMKNWLDTGAVNPKPTFKADEPRTRIDYVLARPSHRWRVVESRVLDESMASDHRPVLAILETTQPRQRN
jgi:endonuclease/exonuclease/phosphatase family metal-dependent hydrolase